MHFRTSIISIKLDYANLTLNLYVHTYSTTYLKIKSLNFQEVTRMTLKHPTYARPLELSKPRKPRSQDPFVRRIKHKKICGCEHKKTKLCLLWNFCHIFQRFGTNFPISSKGWFIQWSEKKFKWVRLLFQVLKRPHLTYHNHLIFTILHLYFFCCPQYVPFPTSCKSCKPNGHHFQPRKFKD